MIQRLQFEAEKANDLARPEVIVINIGAEHSTDAPNAKKSTYYSGCGLGGHNTLVKTNEINENNDIYTRHSKVETK